MVVEKARRVRRPQPLRAPCSIPSSLRELIPDFEAKGAPVTTKVTEDHVYFLTSAAARSACPSSPRPCRTTGTT